MSQMSQALMRRPGMVTFAAIMMFVLGGFQVAWAFVQFANAAWIAANVYGTFGGYLWLWGILDLLFAGVLFYAGFDVLAGGKLGQIVGVVVAGLSAIRWFFYIPAAPWMAIVVIALDVLVLYGLLAYGEYFQSSSGY